MKKIIYAASIFLLIGASIATAKPISIKTAQKVAENFYKLNSKTELVSSTLVYAETSSGLPVYYVFDINSSDGFVIIAAEDLAHPIIGYSTANHFVVPALSENTNIG